MIGLLLFLFYLTVNYIKMEFIILLIFFIGILYLWLTWNYNYWEKRKVPFIKPGLFFGTFKDIFFMSKSQAFVNNEHYWTYNNVPVVGIYKMRQPQLLLKDPSLVQEVLVKNFSSFRDNDVYVNYEVEPFMGVNPFFSRGERWKKSRAVSSPHLTLGKVKGMSDQIKRVCRDMLDFIDKNKNTPLDVKYFGGQYTTDIVASSIFGLESNSFKDPDSMFRQMTNKILNPSFKVNLSFLLSSLAPKVNDFFKLGLLPNDVCDFFEQIVKDTYDYRVKNGIKRNDFLQSLIDDKEKSGYSFREMAAHSMTFVLDGYETSAILYSQCLYELALDQESQEKLRRELKKAFPTLNSITPEAVLDLKFLDAVIKETLRLWPPLISMTKVCTENTKLVHKDGEVEIDKGCTVLIPIMSIHRDEANFEKANEFIPDRFMSETVNNEAFFPFGGGPRMCPGSKFALMAIKMAVVHLILSAKVTVEDKRRKTIPDMDPYSNIFTTIKGGIKVQFHDV